MNILVFNSGSSSVKTRLFDMPNERLIASCQVEKIGQPDATFSDGTNVNTISAPDHTRAIAYICDHINISPKEIQAVGHRVVQGGEQFSEAIRITPEVEREIDALKAFAPLHTPPNVAGIRAGQQILPKAIHVAVFDTAFHQTMPEHAYRYAIPTAYYTQDHIRRYGFHGTSHRYVSERATQILGHAFTGITCHLGNGCSITAIKDGQSIDTSMGFTPLEGVAMGTRSGDIDPAIVLNLARKMGIDKTDHLLNRESGLLGLSEKSNDLRELLASAKTGDTKSQLALDVFTYRIKKYIGSYLAVLGQMDGIVFTGGIGENSPDIRQQILTNLEPLGVQLDPIINKKCIGQETAISTEHANIKVFVIPTDEERLIARETYQLANPP
ncbi:MAG: acetate kinase, partial [Candidatus Latescibacteria bacterium]|nr:acetate kinase [Candidatus Latescibacterota bacterium]